jgi:hypothetical protein
MNEQIARLKKDSARISRRAFFNSAGAAGAGWVAAGALPNSVHADNDKDDDKDKGKGKGHDKEKDKDKDKDKNKGKECSEIVVGPSSVCEMPNPIPHVFTNPFGNFHFFFPAPVEGTAAPTDPTGAHANGRDPSVIYNFRGLIGQADLNLTGAGTNLSTGATVPYAFHTDMRFMKGEFVGTDGRTRRGAFVFI